MKQEQKKKVIKKETEGKNKQNVVSRVEEKNCQVLIG